MPTKPSRSVFILTVLPKKNSQALPPGTQRYTTFNCPKPNSLSLPFGTLLCRILPFGEGALRYPHQKPGSRAASSSLSSYVPVDPRALSRARRARSQGPVGCLTSPLRHCRCPRLWLQGPPRAGEGLPAASSAGPAQSVWTEASSVVSHGFSEPPPPTWEDSRQLLRGRPPRRWRRGPSR